MSIIKTCLFSLIQNFSKLNHAAMLEFLVKREPSLLLEAAAAVQQSVPEAWMIEVIKSIQKNEYVSAIKQVRQSTGMGLKEAKDVVDSLKNGIEMSDMSGNSQAAVCQFMAANLAVAIAPAIVKPEEKLVYIVRYCDDNSIHTIFSCKEAANKRKNELNYESDNHYISSHYYS